MSRPHHNAPNQVIPGSRCMPNLALHLAAKLRPTSSNRALIKALKVSPSQSDTTCKFVELRTLALSAEANVGQASDNLSDGRLGGYVVKCRRVEFEACNESSKTLLTDDGWQDSDDWAACVPVNCGGQVESQMLCSASCNGG